MHLPAAVAAIDRAEWAAAASSIAAAWADLDRGELAALPRLLPRSGDSAIAPTVVATSILLLQVLVRLPGSIPSVEALPEDSLLQWLAPNGVLASWVGLLREKSRPAKTAVTAKLILGYARTTSARTEWLQHAAWWQQHAATADPVSAIEPTVQGFVRATASLASTPLLLPHVLPAVARCVAANNVETLPVVPLLCTACSEWQQQPSAHASLLHTAARLAFNIGSRLSDPMLAVQVWTASVECELAAYSTDPAALVVVAEKVCASLVTRLQHRVAWGLAVRVVERLADSAAPAPAAYDTTLGLCLSVLARLVRVAVNAVSAIGSLPVLPAQPAVAAALYQSLLQGLETTEASPSASLLSGLYASLGFQDNGFQMLAFQAHLHTRGAAAVGAETNDDFGGSVLEPFAPLIRASLYLGACLSEDVNMEYLFAALELAEAWLLQERPPGLVSLETTTVEALLHFCCSQGLHQQVVRLARVYSATGGPAEVHQPWHDAELAMWMETSSNGSSPVGLLQQAHLAALHGRHDSAQQLLAKATAAIPVSPSSSLDHLLVLARLQLTHAVVQTALGPAHTVTAIDNCKRLLRLSQLVLRKLPQCPLQQHQARKLMWLLAATLRAGLWQLVMLHVDTGLARDARFYLTELSKTAVGTLAPLVTAAVHYTAAMVEMLAGDISADSSTHPAVQTHVEAGDRLADPVGASHPVLDALRAAATGEAATPPEPLDDPVQADICAAYSAAVQGSVHQEWSLRWRTLRQYALKETATGPGVYQEVLAAVARLSRRRGTVQLLEMAPVSTIPDSSVLRDLHAYLHAATGSPAYFALAEVARALPLHTDRALHSGDTSTPFAPAPTAPSLLPDPVAVAASIQAQLPPGHQAVSIDCCPISGDLLLTQLCQGPPVHVRLRVSGVLVETATATLAQIIAESDALMKVDSLLLVTREQREDWWRTRFALEARLEELVCQMDRWVGGWRGLFYGTVLTSGLEAGLVAAGVPVLLVPLVAALPRPPVHADVLDVVPACDVLAVVRLLSVPVPPAIAHTYLVVGKTVAHLPWESLPCLEHMSVSRVPLFTLLAALLPAPPAIAPTACGFVLNPSGDLKRTEATFMPKLCPPVWSGVTGTRPLEEVFSSLLASQLFLYLGHGSGDQYISTLRLRKSRSLCPALLVGCSSGALRPAGVLEPWGPVYAYLVGGCPCVVANMWDVTDKDIDCWMESVGNQWGLWGRGQADVAEAVRVSREKCRLRYLNGAAPVVYGVPVSISQGR